MALKTLQCYGDSSLPEQRRTLRAINTLNPPPKIHPQAQEVVIHLFKASARSARPHVGRWGAFPPAAAMVVVVVTQLCFVLRLLKKRNRNTKIIWWLPENLFITI